MIIRCSTCGTRSVTADRGAGPGACPACGAPARRSDRRCQIADRLSHDLACPPGGCHLSRLLEGRLFGDAGDPCAVEAIAAEQPGNPVVQAALHDLIRELEGGGGYHAVRLPAGLRGRRTAS